MKKRKKHNKDINHTDFPHGLSGHRYGCRCGVCLDAKYNYDVTRRKKLNKDYEPSGRRISNRIQHGGDVNHPDFPHGELRGHRAGCRCLNCKKAKADYNLKQKGVKSPKFRKLLGVTPDHPEFPHGTRTGYKYCKCDACKKANNEYVVPLNRDRINRDPEAKRKKAECNSFWRQTERGIAIKKASHAKRRAFKKTQNTCAASDMEMLRQIYLNCPKGYHVDHIVPLSKGGLHHPGNLQYLPAIVNLQKGNDESFDCSQHVIYWQNLLKEPSSTIPKGSTPKRAEVPRTPQKRGDDIVRSLSKDKAA